MPDDAKIKQIKAQKGVSDNRPLFADECVSEAQIKRLENYGAYIKKMPALIKQNGLSQTLAFYFSKSKTKKDSSPSKEYPLILNQIREYLIFRDILENSVTDHRKLMQDIIKMEPFTYHRATLEVLTLATWLGRLSEGVFGGDNDLLSDQ